MLYREDFNPSLFAGRKGDLAKIENWADAPNPPYRLYSVIGSPGIGKSWFLAEAERRLRDKKHRRLIFRLILSRDAVTGQPADTLFNPPNNPDVWLRGLVEQAKQECGGTIHDFDPTISTTARVIQILVEDICKTCRPEAAPLLIVDGFEEVVKEQRRELGTKFLTPFLSAGCTRILLARRDDHSLDDADPYLKTEAEHTLPLQVFQQAESHEQLHARAQHQYPLLLGELNSITASIPPYNWDHPYINARLLERVGANKKWEQSLLIGKADVQACLDKIFTSAQLLRRYTQLVELSERSLFEWLEPDIRPLGFDLQDQLLNELFEIGLVFEIHSRFTVAPGVRELVLAWKRM